MELLRSRTGQDDRTRPMYCNGFMLEQQEMDQCQSGADDAGRGRGDQ